MQKQALSLLLLSALLSLNFILKAGEELPPYFKIALLSTDIDDAATQVKTALSNQNFEVIGEYHPAENPDWYVLAFTRPDLQSICLNVTDRGTLASVLKVGMVKKDGKINVSILNPMYLFNAYLMDEADTHQSQLARVNTDLKTAMKAIGNDMTGFGGGEEADDLKDYHYMMMMPYFTDPVELKTFNSFEEGLATIRKNLDAKKGGTIKVYELGFDGHDIAIFGIGLMDSEDGEAHFLPIIGVDNIAAMPYEIILQGKEATMLHGKYRFALLWPELSMSQFMKISSTPGDVEDMLEALTE